MRSSNILPLLLLLVVRAVAEDMRFPSDAACDVTKPPFGAKGDGVTDDTEAIQRALDRRENLIHFPNGTYIISSTLRWGPKQKRQILQGQSRDGVTLKLADRCPGFSIPERPLAMLWTGSAPAQRFRNGLRNLTLDTGKGNPGAIGAQFIANNQGTIDNVLIRCGESGPVGLDLAYTKEQGPCLLSNLEVSGFDVGIATAGGVNSITAEHVKLSGQKNVGWKNDGQPLFIRDLQSRNSVPALMNAGREGFIVLLDSELQGLGAANGFSAISNADKNAMTVRNLTTTGYKMALQNDGGDRQSPAGATIAEWTSHPIVKAWENSPSRSLALPIKETPDVPWDAPGDWISVAQFGPKKIAHVSDKGRKSMVDDWTDAIQAAIDSGKTTVYFPKDGVEFTGTIHVRGAARRFIGCERPFGKGQQGTWIIEDGVSPIVVFERFDWTYSPMSIRHASARTLVVRNTIGGQWNIDRGAGDVFFSDVCTGSIRLAGARLWARQLNAEGSGETKIINEGGSLWILGLKTEGDSTQIETKAGAQTEVAGAFVYANTGKPKQPCFIVTDSAFSCSMAEAAFRRAPFMELVVETRRGETRELKNGQTPGRSGGSLMTLFSGFPK